MSEELPRSWEMPGELLEVKEAPNRSPSAAPQPKVIAGTAGAGLGSAIGLVLPWLVKVAFGVEMPPEVAVGFAGILSVIGTFAAGYLTPPRSM